MIYKVYMIYYDSKNIQHGAGIWRMFPSELKSKASNYAEVKDLDSVNHIVYNMDSKKIIQAAGFNPDRGMFIDLY